MADVTIDSAITNFGNSSSPALSSRNYVAISPLVHYAFYQDSGTINFVFCKSTDGGATWGSPVTVDGNTAEGAVEAAFAWFDKSTDGIAGGLIHVVVVRRTDSNGPTYYNINTASSDSISAANNFGNGTGDGPDHGGSICKARGGRLYCAYCSGTNFHFYASDDNGATWDDTVASPWEGDNRDHIILAPGGAADTNDIVAIYYDDSTDELTVKEYDQSGDSWSEGSAFASSIAQPSRQLPFAAAPRFSDGHTLCVVGPAVTAAGNVVLYDITDKDNVSSATTVIGSSGAWSENVAITVNQQNDEVFVYFGVLVSGDELNIVYRRSSESYSTSHALSDTSDDYRALSAPLSIDDAGGRIIAAWENNDLGDAVTNFTNSVEVAAAGGISVTPGPAVASWSVVLPSLSLALSASPVAAAWSPGGPTLSLSLSAAPVTATWSVSAPAIGAVVSLDPISASWSVVAPSLELDLGVDPVTAVWSVQSPVAGGTVTPDPVTVAWSAVAPSLAMRVDIAPALVTWSLIAPAVGGAVSVAPVTATWTVVAPSLSMEVELSPITATWSVTAIEFTDAGYNIYRRLLPDDEATLIGHTSTPTLELIVTGSPNSEAWYHVKAITHCGVEDDEPVRLKRVAFDEDGILIPPVPNAPIGLKLECGESGGITARWRYIALRQAVAPARFNVYVMNAAGDIVGQQVVNFAGQDYSESVGFYSHGTIRRVMVRAESAAGDEEKNNVIVTAISDAEAPAAAGDLEVEVIAT